jgi:hypothetical protein
MKYAYTKFSRTCSLFIILIVIGGCDEGMTEDFGGDKNLEEFRTAFDDIQGYRIAIDSSEFMTQGVQRVQVTFVRPDTRHTMIDSSSGFVEAITTRKDTFVRTGDSIWEKKNDLQIRGSIEVYTEIIDNLDLQFSDDNENILFEGVRSCESAECFVYTSKSETGTTSTLLINTDTHLPQEAIVKTADNITTKLSFSYDNIVIEVPEV